MRVPPNFQDVSRIRQLPDNQEVYTDFTSDTSLIVEIVEAHAEAESDTRSAASWHWDAVGSDSSATGARLLWGGTIPKLANTAECSDLSLAAGVQTVAKFKDSAVLASEIRLHLACIILPPRYSTHILLSFAIPQCLHPQGSSARSGAQAPINETVDERDGAAPFYAALNSITIKDWTLFCA